MPIEAERIEEFRERGMCRNLSWEFMEEELVELCKPFGKIVTTKCNVGANHNQAFVEFVIDHQTSIVPRISSLCNIIIFQSIANEHIIKWIQYGIFCKILCLAIEAHG
ncbi:hypothetical protein SUGI_1025060 [Cryptomeria japonica]|nr:hypothetical protein SUGI_1025060 [Cryptomeria japonica]